MRAQLLIKQLTILINSIWLREHKEVAQVQKTYTYLYLWPDLPEWKVRCNGPRAKKLFGLLLQMQMQRDWATRLVCTSDCVSSTRRQWPLARAEPVRHSASCCHHLLANRTRLVMRITDGAASCHLHMTSIISWRSRYGAIDSNPAPTLHGEVVIITRAICLQLCWQVSINHYQLEMANVKAHPSMRHVPYAITNPPAAAFHPLTFRNQLLYLLLLGTLWLCDRRWRRRFVECVFTR